MSPTLRELREAGGLSLRAAARDLGLNHSTLKRYETGDYEPKVTIAQELAKLYGVSIEAIAEAIAEVKRRAVD